LTAKEQGDFLIQISLMNATGAGAIDFSDNTNAIEADVESYLIGAGYTPATLIDTTLATWTITLN
jgi:hypothetical protein